MYGYGYGYSPYSQAASFGSAYLILCFIGFVAAIVLTILLYRKFGRTAGEQGLKPTDKSTWGPFIRFETMWIDKVIRVLYLFFALGFLFFMLALLLSSFALGLGMFIGMLIFCTILTILVELFLRIGFEQVMLNVVIARNTTEIKNRLAAKDGDAPAAPAAPAPEPDPAPVAPAPAPGPMPTHVAAPEPPAVPAEPEQTAPAPEPPAPTSKVCPTCGTENALDAVFCYNCGTRLD